MRLDLHNHTRYSPDSLIAPADVVRVARKAGLDGIAITDHNAVGGIREAEGAVGSELLVIPGIEISTKSGHVLAYGVREVVPRDLSVAETVRRVEALGGVAVAAHPYRFWSGLGEVALSEAPFVAYETSNARTLRRGNERARAVALARRVGQTGGSDSHFLDEIGRAITTIDSGIVGPEDVVEALRAHRTSAEGRSRGASATVRYVTKAVGEWIFRGMRRI
jgi:predicted metal-dependent phosphoesterase TrpH